MIPRFAVVGRVNEGKSSVIATLTENDQVPIGPLPGTTQECASYPFAVRGKALFEVIDTPGFQEPEAMLAWLHDRARTEDGAGASGQHTALDRPRLLRAFVETFRGGNRFQDECELLRPILAGAFVIYVADVSHPYRPGFEAEFEILRWTGAPRLALMNKVRRGSDHSVDWQTALGQYFNIVKPFDAHAAHLTERIAVLRAMRHLDATLAPVLAAAATSLESEHKARLAAAAEIIARLVFDALTLKVSESFDETLPEYRRDELRQQLTEEYRHTIARREQSARRELERLYGYQRLETRDPTLLVSRLAEQDLFDEEVWEFLGLRRSQLLTAAAVSGAAAGGGIDLAVGGHSFFLGTVIGAVAAAGSAAYLAAQNPTRDIVGLNVSGSRLEVGPIKSPQFIWVVLDRALLHWRAIYERTHAQQAELVLPAVDGEDASIVSHLAASERHRLAKVFRSACRAQEMTGQVRERMISAMHDVLRDWIAGAGPASAEERSQGSQE